MQNFKRVQLLWCFGMNPQPSGSFFSPTALYLRRFKPLHSVSKRFWYQRPLFHIAALHTAIEVAVMSLCTGMRWKVTCQMGIWAFLPRQESAARSGQLLLGQSYQNNFVLSYGTKIETSDIAGVPSTHEGCFAEDPKGDEQRDLLSVILQRWWVCVPFSRNRYFTRSSFVLTTRFVNLIQNHHSKSRNHQSKNSTVKDLYFSCKIIFYCYKYTYE